MDEINDDILNKYLDGELNSTEKLKIEKAINISEDIRKRYHALKTVHHNLQMIKADETSADFVSLVMSKINRKPDWFRKQNYFLAAMYMLFIGASLTLISYVTYGILNSGRSSSSSTTLFENTTLFLENFVSLIKDFLKGTNLSVIGSILAFLVIISGYMFFEFFKNTKTNLNKV